MIVVVSACLVGINCKYNGKNNVVAEILEMFREGKVIPVCPEQLGGLSTPRLPAEIVGGDGKAVLCGRARVLRRDGLDVTQNYVRGAEEVLKICRVLEIKRAIFKSKSPSCGAGEIYDGTFKGVLIEGNGVAAQLLLDHGIEVLTEKDFINS